MNMNEMERILNFFLVTGRMERQVQKLKTLYMQDYHLHGSDLPVLFALASQHEDGCRMDELGKMIGADKSQISRSIKKLTEAGLIVKDKDSGYKGRYYLNEKGSKTSMALVKGASQIFHHAHTELTSDQWDEFYGFIDTLTQCMDEEIHDKEEKK